MATAQGISTDIRAIAEALLSITSSADVVGVFDTSFNQVFAQARPLKAEVREVARPMEHPLESGQIITDYRIILPIEIMIPFIVPTPYWRIIYQQISALYQTSTLLSVQTKTSVYQSMIIAEMPHEESPEFYDAIAISIKFKQVILVSPSESPSTPPNFAPSNPANQNTQQSGQQNPSVVYTPNGNFVTPSGIIVSGVQGVSQPNIGPPITLDQQQYNTSGVATLQTQSGFRIGG